MQNNDNISSVFEALHILAKSLFVPGQVIGVVWAWMG